MGTLYYKPHPNRKHEAAFAQALIAGKLASKHVLEAPPISESLVHRPIDTRLLARRLRAEMLLPPRRREETLAALEALPRSLRVATSAARVSCDLAIESQGKLFYYEFHEKQHRSLSVARACAVYDLAGAQFDVPRFVQRFIRDVWRIQNLGNLTVVWFDWFAAAKSSAELRPAHGFREFSQPGRFSFRAYA